MYAVWMFFGAHEGSEVFFGDDHYSSRTAQRAMIGGPLPFSKHFQSVGVNRRKD
jgi:hypothetical protein